MMGKNETEVLLLAEENRRRIDPILAQIKRREPTFLLVNDITLYLQNGKADQLISCIEGIPTIIMNGYYGRYFGKNSFSQRERFEMEALMSRCDRVVFLPPLSMS